MRDSPGLSGTNGISGIPRGRHQPIPDAGHGTPRRRSEPLRRRAPHPAHRDPPVSVLASHGPILAPAPRAVLRTMVRGTGRGGRSGPSPPAPSSPQPSPPPRGGEGEKAGGTYYALRPLLPFSGSKGKRRALAARFPLRPSGPKARTARLRRARMRVGKRVERAPPTEGYEQVGGQGEVGSVCGRPARAGTWRPPGSLARGDEAGIRPYR